MKITQRATGGSTCIQAAGDITLGGERSDLPLMEATRIHVRPGDVVVVSPRTASLTPNQAREYQDHLTRWEPSIRWLVLPVASDLSVMEQDDNT